MNVQAGHRRNAYRGFWMVLIVGMTASALAFGMEQHREIISRLQMMAEGSYTEQEWNSVVSQLDDLLVDARKAGDWNGFVETQVLRANVMSLRGDDDGALALLAKTRDEFESQDAPAVKKVYVEMTSLYAKRGDEAGVARVMDAFRRSRHYDGETYEYKGGFGPNDPLVITRPRASGDESISETAMQVNRTKARYTAGQEFPTFSATGWDGRSFDLDTFRGRVVLVDFWSSGWFIWKRDLQNRRSIYQRYHPEGFEMFGLSIDPDQSAARDFSAGQGMTWPLAKAPVSLTKQLGLFGEAGNFLLDRNGIIIGKDLYGADLDAAVRTALGQP